MNANIITVINKASARWNIRPNGSDLNNLLKVSTQPPEISCIPCTTTPTEMMSLHGFKALGYYA